MLKTSYVNLKLNLNFESLILCVADREVVFLLPATVRVNHRLSNINILWDQKQTKSFSLQLHRDSRRVAGRETQRCNFPRTFPRPPRVAAAPSEKSFLSLSLISARSILLSFSLALSFSCSGGKLTFPNKPTRERNFGENHLKLWPDYEFRLSF